MRLSAIEKFKQPLPVWLSDIKREAYEKISDAEFARLCGEGNKDTMQKLIIGLWPFVDEFPNMVYRGGVRLLLSPELIVRHGWDVVRLMRKSREILNEIKIDEEAHRNLWLVTGNALGLQYPAHYYQDTFTGVQKWMNLVDDTYASPYTMFMRFTAIEIIAECISENLLASKKFCDVLEEPGCRWFKAHIHEPGHAGMTHEELSVHLAFAFHEGVPTKEETNNVIQEVVDTFLLAANACIQ